MTEPFLLQCKPLTWAAWRVTQSKIQILQGICNESISGINNYENRTEPKEKSQYIICIIINIISNFKCNQR